ncbi:hypothetical protein [Methylovulum psychrotolerans]|jgi:hypothetical protein|uniref:Uncharacterized protein n=1 Tax=Methylovulum psychrotolerans TaxID=1704499 RepID=A0A2S5CQ51_9GAMM|nr:hypothetical protein [Methylovulum psychrotolerans]POZ52887.1 hypothetical protein AADEFJLK_01498 [Methylovulum psychrotolerans]
MTELILEFGCNHCYLLQFRYPSFCEYCTIELSIRIKDKNNTVKYILEKGQESSYFNKNSNGSFTIKKDFFYRKIVPDVYRYDLKFDNSVTEWKLYEPNTSIIAGDWVTKTSNDGYGHPIQIQEDANNILIILESPHIEEYEYPSFIPLQPANGETGIRFSKYFTGHILPLLEALGLSLCRRETYRICFVNPVPFQTSLHFIHQQDLVVTGANTLRNNVWKKIFPHCEIDFEQRLRSYKPIAILNSCTTSLDKRVKKSIDNIIKTNNKIQTFNTYHPSKWEANPCSKG